MEKRKEEAVDVQSMLLAHLLCYMLIPSILHNYNQYRIQQQYESQDAMVLSRERSTEVRY